jgi:hypothetical protein
VIAATMANAAANCRMRFRIGERTAPFYAMRDSFPSICERE